MKKNKKITSIIMLVLVVSFLVFFLVGMVMQLAVPDSSFGEWAKNYIWDLSKVSGVWEKHQKTLMRCITLIVFVFSFSWLLRFIFKKMMEKSNRAKTVITLLDGLIKYGSALVLISLFLQACGVNTALVWESVGILTLIIGLGAQSLIADIIAGIFIIFEDEYSVGEIVSIDDFRGTVSEIGIRATKVLDLAGNIKIINNSDIKNVVNLSRELSLAVVDCDFPYDVPMEFVENLLKDNLERFHNDIDGIVEGPFYKGVSGYAASNVSVRLIAKCKEDDRYQVQRDLLRAYRQLFVQNGIDISFDQVVVSQAKPSNIVVSKKNVEDANKFFKEQQELTKGLEEQEKE